MAFVARRADASGMLRRTKSHCLDADELSRAAVVCGRRRSRDSDERLGEHALLEIDDGENKPAGEFVQLLSDVKRRRNEPTSTLMAKVPGTPRRRSPPPSSPLAYSPARLPPRPPSSSTPGKSPRMRSSSCAPCDRGLGSPARPPRSPRPAPSSGRVLTPSRLFASCPFGLSAFLCAFDDEDAELAVIDRGSPECAPAGGERRHVFPCSPASPESWLLLPALVGVDLSSRLALINPVPCRPGQAAAPSNM